MIDPSRVKDLNNFQEKIGIRWKNIRLLDQALTHSSYAKSSIQPACDNERIEFLGDAVLELVISDYLFRKFSYLDEGGLSRMRSAVVSEESLANHARKMGLGDYILVGKDQEQIRLQDAILADAYEAVIGALYLDQGLKAAKKFILNFFIKEENLEINGKTLGEGWGPSKKKAEKIAAKKAWEKINTEENSK